ncbi:hypothetical protein GCM10011341_20550 [Frigidibacter albus]|nr:hypothetical protein GCM10011341_20550 [Frigidibacter albus]
MGKGRGSAAKNAEIWPQGQWSQRFGKVDRRNWGTGAPLSAAQGPGAPVGRVTSVAAPFARGRRFASQPKLGSIC